MANRFNVCTPRPKKDGGTHWHSVGTAWQDEKGVTVYLDSSPYPDSEGRVVLKLFEPRDNDRARSASNDRQQAQSRAGSFAEDDGDSIPF